MAPSKWVQRFNDNTGHAELVAEVVADPFAALQQGQCDLALVRLPDVRIDDAYHQVKLYDEALGIALPREHVLELLDVVAPADIADEIVHHPLEPQQSWDIAQVSADLQVVAANVGVALAPLPLLRDLSGKQISVREYADPAWALPEPPVVTRGQQVQCSASSVVLVWAKAADSPAIQDFVGVCKGRRAGSSRQNKPQQAKTRNSRSSKQPGGARRGAHQPASAAQRAKKSGGAASAKKNQKRSSGGKKSARSTRRRRT